MFTTVRELNQQFVDRWMDSDASLPDLGPRFSAQAQAQNEKSLLHFLDQVEAIQGHPPRSREEAQALKSRLGIAFACLAEEVLGITQNQLDLLPSDDFSDAAEEFVRQARAFDPRLSMEDIYQAGRNAWTAHGLQWLLGRPVRLTSSIFAYSLLYPYTDNYIDDPGISRESKLAFNERFRQRLIGDRLLPVNAREQVIFDLVAMIEKQYSRSEQPRVFESLLAIHDAQSQSVKLLHRSASPGDVDVVGLSFYKGGTSVLADGYLADGFLTGAQRQYAYGHGIFAQLLDDLEDMEEDFRVGRLTVFSQVADRQPLDAIASRTFQFGHRILMDLDCFDLDKAVGDLVRHGADLLLIDAIGRTERYYSPAYVGALETYSPFRFSFLKDQRNDFFKRHGPLENWVEILMHAGRF